MNSEKDRAVERANQAESERDDAADSAQEAEMARRDAADALAQAQGQISDLQAQLHSAETSVAQLEAEKATIVAAYDVDLSNIVAVPDIDAAVLEVRYDVAPGLVALNVGSADKVTRGMSFDIYSHAEGYKGRVKVESVREDMCSALVTIPVEGVQIRQGDQASTQL